MTAHAPQHFSAPTREWFDGAFPAATPAQVGAWKEIVAGSHALVVAPTGSGKTLAAFLSALDSFVTRPPEPGAGTRVLYISPLKALGVDVERNLRAPLVGITQTALRLGQPVTAPTVGVRSGDTTAQQRRQMLTVPPDILITTPESLYLMLTSRAAETLAHVETVIVDEVHAVAGTKRGAHLALSLERLDALLARPAQRIGLSATVEPREEVARFLGGRQGVTVVAPPSQKSWELRVRVPVEDMANIPAAEAAHDSGPEERSSIWPHIERQIVDLVRANRSTIVFANSRRAAERLTARLNEVDAEVPHVPVRQPAQMMGDSAIGYGAPPDLARAHHGSVSKEQRAQIEEDLKSGRLRCVVATSSLELGIDMGLVDLVIQVEAPPSVAAALQRVGRAGHQVGAPSVGAFFPAHRADVLHTALTVRQMRAGAIEPLAIPTNPLDILAQQTVAACALAPLDVEAWWDTVRRAAPFTGLPRSAFEATLDLLAGKYPSSEFSELRPRVVWDRIDGVLRGRPGAQRLAVTSGGTIPDRGMFGVYIVGTEETTRGGRRVGELDEEMVYESRVGDVFALGATSWRIEDITHDRVLVSPAFGQPGRLPFWHGDGLGRPIALGRSLGAFQRALVTDAQASEHLSEIGLDENAVANALAYVREQKDATGTVPSDKELVIERFTDELGDWRVVLHSPFGMAVHAPWALAVSARVRERYGVEAAAMAADDGIVLRIPMIDDDPPGAELFLFDPAELADTVTQEVGGSALFASRFRECAARALLLPRRNPGARAPLWQQRLRASQLLEVARKYPTFPIILETVRECLQDVYDLPALTEIAADIAARRIRLREVSTDSPSPFAKSLLFGYVAQFMYDADAPLAERRAAALSLDSTLLGELLGRVDLRELLDPGVVEKTERELQRLAPERRLRGEEGAADLLRLLGPLSAAELARRLVAESKPEPAEDSPLIPHGQREGDASVVPHGQREGDASVVPHGEGEGDASVVPHGERERDAAVILRGGREGDSSVILRGERSSESQDPSAGSSVDSAALREMVGEGMPSDSANDLAAESAREGESTGDDTHAVLHATTDEACGYAETLVANGRALSVTVAGEPRYAAIEDASRLRDALGVPLPIGVPQAFAEPVDDPLGDLVGRYAATHGPFTTAQIAAYLGLPPAPLAVVLARLEAERRVTAGEFTPGRTEPEWCHTDVLRQLRRRSLAALRSEIEPVPGSALARFVTPWQEVGSSLSGADGVAVALEQLAGIAAPASAWESFILPARVRDYQPALLDAVLSTGEIIWAGNGQLSAADGWISFHIAADASVTLTHESADELTESQQAILAQLRGGARFAREIETPEPSQLTDDLWSLVWAGHLTNDTFAPIRALAAGSGSTHKKRVVASGRTARVGRLRGRSLAVEARIAAERRYGSAALHAPSSGAPIVADGNDAHGTAVGTGEGSGSAAGTKPGKPRGAGAANLDGLPGGRWSALPEPSEDQTAIAVARAEYILDRYGVVTKGVATAEQYPGGYGALYRVLTRMEDRNLVRRGYFVEHLGASQFALPGVVDRLRGYAEPRDPCAPASVVVLAATDPANPYGAALPWPASRHTHRPGRKAGAVVVLGDGELVLYMERGGKTALTFGEIAEPEAIAASLVRALRRAQIPRLAIETLDGQTIIGTQLARALLDAGFYSSPRAIRFRS